MHTIIDPHVKQSKSFRLKRENMTQLMNQDEWAVLCYIEERWLRKQIFPEVAEISRKSGVDQVKVVEALSNPLVQQSLEVRGIPLVVADNNLKANQVACINLLLNFSDRRTQSAKLKALGINPSTFQGWKRQAPFAEAYRAAAERLFGEAMPDIHLATIDRARDGDMAAIKQVYAMQGYWDDHKSVETMNIRFVMVRLLETIQKHVKDPVALQAIATEFEGLVSSNGKELNA